MIFFPLKKKKCLSSWVDELILRWSFPVLSSLRDQNQLWVVPWIYNWLKSYVYSFLIQMHVCHIHFISTFSLAAVAMPSNVFFQQICYLRLFFPFSLVYLLLPVLCYFSSSHIFFLCHSYLLSFSLTFFFPLLIFLILLYFLPWKFTR